ncbi:MAG: TIGR00366 family protein, partial [Actinomycetota bacterium]|nr:TIGR00366 family protein [Actinomycetota bacterium]
IPLLVVLFSLAGGTIGLAEEALAILPALVVLVRRLGYDDLLAGAIGLAGAAAGFSGAFLNPFTIGVGQAITGLPLFSGLAYRLVVWTVVTIVTTLWITRAARRLKLPSGAVVGRGMLSAPAAAAPEEEVDSEATAASEEVAERVTQRQQAVLLALLAAIVLLVAGALRWHWGLLELSGLFVGTAIVAGIAGGLGADRTAESFVNGASGFAGAALVVGLARGVLVIFDGAHVTDTILHSLVGVVRELPAALTVVGIYAVQVLLSYVVPSGSGQAALSLPILAPLGDLVGVTRQTSVLAYQFGDGFSNVFTPTQGYFMAGLAMLRVPWTRWVKFLWPLQLIWLAMGLAFLLIAQAMRWGPF